MITHWKVKYEGEITVWSEATSRRGPEHIQGSNELAGTPVLAGIRERPGTRLLASIRLSPGPKYRQGSASSLGFDYQPGPKYRPDVAFSTPRTWRQTQVCLHLGLLLMYTNTKI